MFSCVATLWISISVMNLVSWFSSTVPILSNVAASEPFNTPVMDWTQTHLTSKKYRLTRGNAKPCASRQQIHDQKYICKSISWQPSIQWTMTRVNYRTLKKGTGCHNFVQVATYFQFTSPGQNSYQQGLPVNHRPEHPCSHLSSQQLVKKQQAWSTPKDTYIACNLLNSIHYFKHLQDFQILFFLLASCTLFSVSNIHFHEPFPSDFLYVVAADFFQTKREDQTHEK